MRKIRYKEASQSFLKLAAPADSPAERISVGMDKFIGEYYYIDIDNLIPYKNQARIAFDSEELENLAKTIKDHGIRQPLTIIKSREFDGKFEIVSGERRFRAAKIVGMKKVPCIIIDEAKAEEIALIENIQRSDLHPVELGDALKSLLSNSEWGDITKLAEKIGKDHSTISNHLSYSKLPEDIKLYLIENNIRSREILRSVIKCETVEQMQKALGIINNNKPSVSKSILRITLIGEDYKVQSSAIRKINFSERQKLKEHLLDLVREIDSIQ